jgi:hypothetical protein
MNMIQLQDRLKGLSQDQLVQEMQMPTGQVPQFLVLSELTRRKKMEDAYAMEQGRDQSTVAQDAIAAAGMPAGFAGEMAGAMAPQTDMAGNTGAMPQQAAPMPEQMPQQMPVQGMAGGGIVALQAGGQIVVRDGRRFVVQPDGTLLSEDESRRVMTPGQNIARDVGRLRDAIGRPEEEFQENFDFLGTPSLADVPVAATSRNIGGLPPGAGMGAPQSFTSPSMPAGVDRFEPVGSSQFHAPSGMMYSEMDDMQLRMLAQTGDPSAAAMLAGNQEAPVAPAAAPTPVAPVAPEPAGRGRSRATPSVTTPGMSVADRLFGDRVNIEPSVREPRGGRGRDRTPAGPAMPELDPTPEAIRSAEEAAALRDEAGITTSLKTPEEVAAAAAAARAAVETERPKPPAPPGPPGGPGGIAAMAAQGAGAPTDFQQELMNMLEAREKRAEQDKWLALAQAGMALMSSKDPTFGGALGEAGQAGLGALRESRTTSEADRLALLGQLEQSRLGEAQLQLQRQALAARAAGSGGGGGAGVENFGELSAGQARLVSQYDEAIADLDEVLTGAVPGVTEDRRLAAARQREVLTGERDSLIRSLAGVPFGAVAGGGSGVYSMDDVTQ